MKEKQIKELYKNCSSIITEKTQEIHNLILGQGNLDSKIMIISEAPSTKEEEENKLFIGKNGENLEMFLDTLGVNREDTYITNIVKYRPYTINNRGRIVNRNIEKEDINFFLPYLLKEIEIIAPRIIITLGNSPLKVLMEDDTITANELIGKLKKKHINDIEYNIIPMYHPSAITFTESLKEKTNDLKILKDLIEVYINEKIDTSKIKANEEYKILPKKENIEQEHKTKKAKPSKLKTIIVYGGNGYADDPTQVAIDKISGVLTELNVRIIRIDLHKGNLEINSFIDELETAQGIIVATTIEWYGIGGLLQSFLDECWKYGNKEIFEDIYIFPIVISRQAYERDAYIHLIKSWEILGTTEAINICTNIKDSVELETDKAMLDIMEKKAEDFYRIINQKRVMLPTSIRKNRVFIEVKVEKDDTPKIDINKLFLNQEQPQEIKKAATVISNYDEYIEKQQQDIEDIANIFKKKIITKENFSSKALGEILKEKYINKTGEIRAIIQWIIEDSKSESTLITLNDGNIKCEQSIDKTVDVTLISTKETMEKIIEGKITVQRAFMTGELKAKGNFTILYKIDTLFDFS